MKPRATSGLPSLSPSLAANTMDYAAEMFNLCRQHMNMATSFSSDINEKGLKHTIDTKYSYHET